MINLMMMTFLACGDKEEDTSVEAEECVCECEEQEVEDTQETEDTSEEVVEEDPQDTSTPE